MHETNFKHDLKSRFDVKAAQAKEEADHEIEVYRLVDVRDKRRCRVCAVSADPNAVGVLHRAHHHHVIYRSAGGPTETWNIALLCAKCHNAEHKHVIQIEGNADEGLTIWKQDAERVYFMWKREISVGRFEKD